MFWESEGGADPAVFVEDTVLHYRLVSTIHALNSRASTPILLYLPPSQHHQQPTCTVNVAVAGHQETGYGEDTEGVLVVKTETVSRKCFKDIFLCNFIFLKLTRSCQGGGPGISVSFGEIFWSL